MGCTAVAPNSTAAERGRYLCEHLPPGLFRVAGDAVTGTPWRISPEPFRIAPSTLAKLETLGADLLAFYRVLAGLYTRSARGTIPGFLAEYLDQGKPESVVKLARQNRFRSDVPLVIRPDLILTDDGFVAAELDSVPGGMGFVSAMAQTYCELGFDTVGEVDGIADGFAAMCAELAHVERPRIAIVVSDESADYRNELAFLAGRVRARGRAEAYACRPQDIVFTEEALFLRHEDGREDRIDVVYRNFELFDLPNVPKSELILYAARHNRVKLTPPPKAPLEEKSSFAFVHHPALERLWRKELGPETFARLRALFPQTWILDPRPVPPQAAIPGLTVDGTPLSDWMQLETLGKGDRDYVVKPSGFSELAWGSRGVKVANDLTREEWRDALLEGLGAYQRTPYILQRFHKGRRVRIDFYDSATDSARPMDGRVRLCPFYFVVGETPRIGGILATIAPADKRLIHGMSEAVMAPCIVADDGA